MSVLKIRNKSGSWTQIPTIKGERGEKGDPFVYSDFTPEQLESLKGSKGDKGDKGDDGDTGESGVYIGTTPPEDEDINVWIKTDENPDSAINDVQINGTSIVQDGVAEIPIASANDFGVIKIKTGTNGGLQVQNGALSLYSAGTSHIKAANNSIIPITPAYQHQSVFYGLAKAAGDTTQSQSDNSVGTYTEEAKTAIRTMLGLQDVYDDYSSALEALGVI